MLDTTLNAADAENAARIQQMTRSWDAYFGRFPKPLHNRPRKHDDSVTLNYCRPIVDKGVSFLFGKDLSFQVPATAKDGGQDWLDATWKANKKMSTLQKLGINGGVTGHPFLKILLANPYPRLIILDPAMVSVEYAPDDMDTISAYCIEYESGETAMRQRIERVNPVSWQILDQTCSKNNALWVTTQVTPWRFPFPPIVDTQNLPHPLAYFGLSDIGPDIIQLNVDLNFIASNIQRIIRFHAHPKTYVSGMQGNRLNTAADETIILPEGATMGSLEMHGDLASSMAFADTLKTAMEILSGVPSIAMGDLKDVPRGQVTGVALEILYQPMLEKTETKRRLYGDMLIELNRRLLAIGGYGADIETTIEWPVTLPTDDLLNAQIAQLEIALGVSKDTVFRKRLGLDYADEVAKSSEPVEDTDADNGLDPQLTDTTGASPANSAADDPSL